MRRLLTKNPNHRISTEEALQHPFIATHCSFPPAGVPLLSPVEVLNSLRVFGSLNLVLKIVLQLVAYALPPEQLSSFRYEFQQIDSNHDGILVLSELLMLGADEEAQEIEALFRKLTVRHPTIVSGSEPSISYSEFLAAAICHR
jgi:serine/threonine protein kinase